MKLSVVLVIFLVKIVSQSEGLENGLARTPPMGWTQWIRYGCNTDCRATSNDCVNEILFKRTADLLVSNGYAAAGYKYVIIDDCWQEHFTQKLVADRDRFPSGLQSLAEYIHKKGLKFGLTYNLKSSPDIIKQMKLDTQTFAEWGVDYVKVISYDTGVYELTERYKEFGNLLSKTERSMVYSCGWASCLEQRGEMPDYKALMKTCNSWQNWKDITDSYASILDTMDFFANNEERFQSYGGPGHWNDPDMLIIGNYGLTYGQSKVQMAIWAILAAPLIMSNDLNQTRMEIKDILINRNIIEVNQDCLGIQGGRILVINEIEVWARPINPWNNIDNYSYAIAFVSRRRIGRPSTITLSLAQLGLHNANGYKVFNLFMRTTDNVLYKPNDTFMTRVNPSEAGFFKFTIVE